MPDWIDELERLQKLKESGALTDAEFAAEKANILDRSRTKAPVEPVDQQTASLRTSAANPEVTRGYTLETPHPFWKSYTGLFAIGILLFSFVIVVRGCGHSEAPSAKASETPSYYVGDTLQRGNLQVTITSVDVLDSVGGDMLAKTASAGAEYVALQYTITNSGPAPVSGFSMPSVHLIDTKGTTYDADITASGYYAGQIHSDQKILSDLNPGITTKGAAVFEISKNSFSITDWHAFFGSDSDALIALVSRDSTASVDAQAPDVTPVSGNDSGVSASDNASAATASFADDLSFDDYPADSYPGTINNPDFSGQAREFRLYRTQIMNAAQGGVSFGGSLAIAQFGCGTECLMGYAIDLRDGAVYDLPVGGENYPRLTLGTKPNSNLLFAEWGTPLAEHPTCTHAFFQWNDGAFVQIQKRELPGICPSSQ